MRRMTSSEGDVLLKGWCGKGKQMKTKRGNKSIKESRKKVIARANRGCWMILQNKKRKKIKRYFPFCDKTSIIKPSEYLEGDGYNHYRLKFPHHGTEHVLFKPFSLEITRVTKITMITRITRITSEKKYG
jgi:hypothetical protein